MAYTSAQPYFYGTGRRKKSVARVRLVPGTGKVTINGRTIDEYFGLETMKLIVNQPFGVTNTVGKFDIICTVKGGGFSGQAGAIRHGLSKALLASDEYTEVLRRSVEPFREIRMRKPAIIDNLPDIVSGMECDPAIVFDVIPIHSAC